ncbi:hypothetical protein CsSME_00032836 [Camellia sinensis var. sinensis]
MSEKGGKGFSLPKASLKGKDDSSAKSKRPRKVQFDYKESLESTINLSAKSGAKVGLPIGKDWGKGGKGDNVANGGKSPVSKESSTLELKVEQVHVTTCYMWVFNSMPYLFSMFK